MVRNAFAVALFTLLSPLAAQVVPTPAELLVAHDRRIPFGQIQRGPFGPQVEALIAGLGALGFEPAPGAAHPPTLVFRSVDSLAGEAYRIRSEEGALIAEAGNAEGAARAAATLLQLAEDDGWPALTVEDAPTFPFRCFMVDMGRNPHSPAVLRDIVDTLWLYKVRYLQLHLTDDQMGSWPSRAYPKILSDRAGWTWEDFEALEAYASARGVAIIPEIDVPAHSTILRRHYPEVFGESPTDLATLESAQGGVETLIDECLEVFASTPYVHIGADEAYGVDVTLQRDFINRLDDFVRRRGRRTIVWEGPSLGEGDNKVHEGVLHMNWRTVNVTAQAMLDAGYEVVNAAWDPFYIVDHYPKTMFTAVDLERCYGWAPQRFAHVNAGIPTFGEGHRTTTAEGIVGFCMPWWEGREENVLPLCVPRIAAVAAGGWNREGEDDYGWFERRQRHALSVLERVAGFGLPVLPIGEEESQRGNVAFRARVAVDQGGSQPHFGPDRLTNGITSRFDHFLGFPCTPEPLAITVDLGGATDVGRIVVHETAVGESHELYDVLVSRDGGQAFEVVGRSEKGSRGDRAFVEHSFEPRPVTHIRIRTSGCHGLTFPSFSRLCEIQAFAR